MKNFIPMQEYIDSMPKPKTIREKTLYLWTKLIDRLYIFVSDIGYAMRRRKHGRSTALGDIRCAVADPDNDVGEGVNNGGSD